MKVLLKTLLSAVIFTAAVFAAHASGVENKTNMSTGYLRNPSRNTENSRPEAAFYNIAGTSFMDDGLFFELGNQFVIKEYGNELATGNQYAGYGVSDYYSNDETTVLLYPDFDAVYKKDRWAISGNFGVYAGGGSLSYSEGTSATSLMFLQGTQTLLGKYNDYSQAAKNAGTIANSTLTDEQISASTGKTRTELQTMVTTNNAYATTYGQAALASLAMAKSHSLDVTSITYGFQLGASYLVTKWLSLAAAYRYTIGTQTMSLVCNDSTFISVNGGNKISYDAIGYGQSMVFGIHAKPPVVPGLDLSLQYQTLSRIDYDVSNVEGNVAQYYNITNSSKFRTDLPAVLNIGAGYKIIDPLYVSLSFNYYFNNFAHQDSILSTTSYDDSWEIAAGVDYKICKYVGVSAGVEYGKQGATDTSNSTFNPVLDSLCFGAGVEVYPVNNLTITAAGLYADYFDKDLYLSGNKTVLSKKVTNFSIGATYHFPLKSKAKN